LKVAISIGGSAPVDIMSQIEFAICADEMGVDTVWSAEGWGEDAVTSLTFLAARTKRIKLGAGIMQISARAPTMTAMTARAISNLSVGRFLLGLGVSGPQVVEGLHSVRYNQPLTRLRENVEIIRQTFSGTKVAYQGKHYQIPLDNSEGKSIRVQKPMYSIPIYLATISPRALEYTGRVADGWLGASFSPDFSDAHFEHIRRGAEAAGRKFEDIEIHVPCSIAIDDDWTASIEKRRSEVAFSLGAMGSKKTNFYNDAYARAGFGEEASRVQSHWIQGRHEEAVSNVTDAMVTKFSAIGDKREVQARLQCYKNAGVDVLVLRFLTDDNSSRVAMLEQVLEMTADLV
tara:strand:+ start:1719 stop:2753 length:1035 start_codon:yes stop_codon:yes gene_type:complete